MIDPVEALLKSTTVGQVLPTATPTSVDPLPTVLPSIENQHVTKQGIITLWIVFVIMVLSSALFAGWSLRVPVSNRLYHVITTTITTIAAISYFMMATGQGIGIHETKIHEHHENVDVGTDTLIRRQVFWARYVDWTLTTPLLLLDLGILAGLSGAHILMAVIADIIMILMGLFAAFGNEHTAQKWGDYTIAIIAFLVVVWHLALNGRNAVQPRSQNVASFYTAIAVYTLVVWAAYPIIWGVADGGRHLSVNKEIIAYAVLDVLAKPVFGLWLLLTHAKIAETNVPLGGFWSNGLNREGALRLDEEEGA